MLSVHKFCINRNITGASLSNKVIEDDVRNSFVGIQYAGLGVIQDFNVTSIGFYSPVDGKRYISRVPIKVEFNIFSIPSGFIISNATIIHIKPESNNTTFVFKCDFYDITGKLIPSTNVMLKGKNAPGPGIIATMITMGKNAETLTKYNFLKLGDKVNIVCLTPVHMEGKTVLAFNCDLIEHAEPKYFKYNSSIDISEIVPMFVKDKVNYPLFSKHNMSKYTTELEEDKYYAMTIYGFSAVESQEGNESNAVDFVKLDVTISRQTSNSDYETILGFDTLNKYLYYVLYNWRCAIEGLKKD